MATKIIGINTDFMGFGSDGENGVYVGDTPKTLSDFLGDNELSPYSSKLTIGDFLIITALDGVGFLRVSGITNGAVSLGQEIATDTTSISTRITSLESRVSALETNAGNTQQTLPGQLQFDAASATINEGANTTVRINRVNGSDGVVSCVLTITGMTVTTEYTSTIASGATITFADGETQKTLTFTSVADSILADDAAVLTLGTFQRAGVSDSAIEGIRSTLTINVLDTGGGGTGTTYDYYVSASATSGAGTSGDPWSIDQMCAASIPAGSDVLVRAGTYTRTATNDNSLPAYQLANGGTSGNPIRIFAEYNANKLTEASPNRSALTTTGGNGAVIGSFGLDYIEWHGFFIDESLATPRADTGPVVFEDSTGCRVSKCYLKGATQTTFYDNHNAIRLERDSGTEIDNNFITGFRVTGTNTYNGAAIMTYDSTDWDIHNNEITNCQVPFYLKGHSSGLYVRPPGLIYKNHLHDCDQGARIGGVIRNTGTVDIYQNIFANLGANPLSWQVFADSPVGAPVDIRVVNNLFYGFTDSASYSKSPSGAGAYSGTVFNGCVFQNNIIVGSNSSNAISSDDNSLATAFGNFSAWNYNRYHGFNQFHNSGSNSFAQFQSAGFDVNGSTGDPQLENPGAGNYKLASASPCKKDQSADGVDILNLRGGGTSGTIALGPYVSDAQTEAIGIE